MNLIPDDLPGVLAWLMRFPDRDLGRALAALEYRDLERLHDLAGAEL